MNNLGWKLVINQLHSVVNEKITVEDYEDFQKELILYILQGKRHGQAFCDHFSIKDLFLYNIKDPKNSEHWIKENYL